MIEINNKNIIPSYLSIENKLFNRIIQIIIHNPTSNDIEQIQQMAFFMHKIYGYKLLYDLWSNYLQAGTEGFQLNELPTITNNEDKEILLNINLKYWSNYIKSNPQNITTNEKDQIVQETLNEYQRQMEYYQKQFNNKKIDLQHIWTIILEEILQKFIEQYGLFVLQMKCNLNKIILKYDYENEILQRKYEQMASTNYQVI